MSDQTDYEAQAADAAAAAEANGTGPGPDPEPTFDDQTELALRGRITVLEEWRARAEPALALVIVGSIGLAIAGLLLLLLIRRKAAT